MLEFCCHVEEELLKITSEAEFECQETMNCSHRVELPMMDMGNRIVGSFVDIVTFEVGFE